MRSRRKCLNGASVPVVSPDFRYAIALASLRKGQLLDPNRNFVGVPELSEEISYGEMLVRRPERMSSAEFQAEYDAWDRNAKGLLSIGECLVRAEPAEVVSFLRAEGFVERGRASDPLLKSLSGCVGENSLKIGLTDFAGLLALSYLRLIYAAEPNPEDSHA